MHPECFTVFGHTIYWFGIMIGLAFLAGILNWWHLGRREGKGLDFASDLAFWIMIAAILGARIVFVLSEWDYFRQYPSLIWRIDQGGIVFYGGFLGASLVVCWIARQRREPLLNLGDFAVTSLPLGHVLGRVGCFINGCCYGQVYHGSLAVRYPADSTPWRDEVQAGLLARDAPQSLPMHPIQLYEAAACLLIFLFLRYLYQRPGRRPGQVLAGYLMTYPLVRFLTEFLRGDGRVLWLGLHVAQWISLLLFLIGIALWTHTRARHANPSLPG